MDAAMLLSWGVVILILAPSTQANASSAGLFEEDILVRLSPGLKDLIRTAGETPRMRRAAESPARSRLWPGGVVPYRMDPTLDAMGRDVINAAIQEVNAKSCVRLVPRTNQRDFIRFFIGNGCYSHVGRQGGRQDVSIGRGCEYKGTVIQQIMHVLGFYLEHTRYDRDNHVTIQWENILTGMRSQFSKRPRSEVDTLGPYDTLSVMHYGSYAFSRDGTFPTITDKSGEPIATRRPNEGMSDLDVTKLNNLYNCAKQPENSDQRMAGFIS